MPVREDRGECREQLRAAWIPTITPTEQTPMISSQTNSAVKQALLEKLRLTIVPQMERLVESLPEQLVDFSEAETVLRQGILRIARGLLEAWGQVADSAIERPCCS